MNKRHLILTLAVLATQPLHAAKFANQFVEFELPPKWQCNLEGAEWVCQGADETKKRDAIIVLAAKLRGDQDSLDQYLNYLKQPKMYNSVQGKPVKSDPKYAKTSEIGGHAWVDSLHLESEVPGFYTRYLATIKQDIGVLVTYSINKDKYQEYLRDFENMVQTLKVFRKPNLNGASQDGSLFKNIPQHVTQGTIFQGVTPKGAAEGGSGDKKGSGSGDLLILLAAGGIVGFIIWRRRKKS